jgi:hypothetical protein
MQYALRHLRWLILVQACCAGAALAEVSCEQLGQIALSTEQLRDQGYALADVMMEADRLDTSGKFSATEMFAIRKAINDSFLRTRTANEIFVECREKTEK